MKIPLSWLSDYVELPDSIEELSDRLTYSGLEIEGVEKIGGDLDGVVVAEVLTAAIKLYAARIEFAQQFPAPLTQEATATDVVIAVTEMIRFADLNMFDVNMWLNRPRPEN